MIRTRSRLRRLGALLLAALLPLSAARAARVTATPPIEPLATLAPGTPKYDSSRPESLDPDQLYAWSAILIEAGSGEVIFEKSSDDIRYPASTTKIMTVLLALTMLEDRLGETVVCSEEATAINNTGEDITSLGLQAGEEIVLEDLIYGTMIMSANDGANVIAEAVSGSIGAFVELMNRTAQEFGCTNTHFANPHGLFDEAHYTTPRDLAIIARYAMMNDTFRDIVASQSYTMPKTNVHRQRTVSNTNQLLTPPTEAKANSYYYEYATGMKTGYLDKAQYCFVGSAEKDGVELISVVMYTTRSARWTDTVKLMNYGFSQYVNVTPLDLYALSPVTIVTSNYALDDAAAGKLQLNCVAANAFAITASMSVTRARAEELAQNLRERAVFQYTRDFVAPITAGEVLGTMTYYFENGTSAVYNLTAARTVPARQNVPPTLAEIEARTESEDEVLPRLSAPLVAAAVAALLAASLVLTVLIRLLRRAAAIRHRAAATFVEEEKPR